MASTPFRGLYTSTLFIPYSSASTLNTLDLHRRTAPSNLTTSPSLWIIYLHGGAFRDPLLTSLSLTPSLPSLFAHPQIAAVASINYRLSPYPTHPTHPSHPTSSNEDGRNVIWPTHINDIRAAITFLHDSHGLHDQPYIVVGHSVGATMGMILAMNHPAPGPSPNPDKWGAPTPTPNLPSSISQNLVAVVGLAGIYDFSACRDAHVEWRDVYEEFITAAFGAEELGGWERGDLVRYGEVLRDGVRVVVMGYSEEDELVEVAQAEAMERALEGREKEREGKGAVVKRVEVKGGHDEMVEQGVEIARCVGVALEVVLDPAGGSSENC